MVLLDPDNRVLLIEEAGNDGVAEFHHWLTPGGGVEAGETWPDAAVREVVEETGVRVELAPDAVEVHQQRRLWSWDGIGYDQVDHFFGAAVASAFQVAPAALTEMEQQTVLGARWWSVSELRASTATFIPARIADLVERVAPTVARPAARYAGRMLVIDPTGCVLLIQTRTDVNAADRHWVAPGGGLEPGESLAQAAVRELREETGIVVSLPDGDRSVFSERAVFAFSGNLFDQTDYYFVARVETRPTLDHSGFTELEREVTTGTHWWSAADLRASIDTVWPVGLADVLVRLNA